ncbi:MAG: HEPN domain-containing protein [Candidatus Omnitrophica bacterium]|nr:HEPN domain-containing protein [Candidatus Omnitrophota bacterium]MBU4488364.1 HEPN domain-containing protein [Candidatus Omnitrophota bacterium]MCG2704876.1 HEPN domain-containing protein [Candidatus Omnitrophota bacterium]
MDYSDLVKENKLKKEPDIGFDQVERLLKRSRKDLTTARQLIGKDEELAVAAIYDAMFHAANALIRMQGYRPGTVRQHIGVIEAVNRTLGKNAENLIIKFDNMRVARNKFEYQAILDMSKAQLDKALQDAEELAKMIAKHIFRQNPQRQFDF